jgi:hypothetical protein
MLMERGTWQGQQIKTRDVDISRSHCLGVTLSLKLELLLIKGKSKC